MRKVKKMKFKKPNIKLRKPNLKLPNFDYVKEHLLPICLIVVICVQSVVLIILGVNVVYFVAISEELEDRNEYLEDNYDDLENELEVEQCLRIGNSLASYYDNLRQSKGFTGATYWGQEPIQYWQDQVDFAADLGLHDLGRKSWAGLEQDYNSVVGEYSFKTASDKIDDVVDLISVSNSDSNTVKIRKILDFIVEYISYEYDLNDLFSAPVETLGFRSGDCDDFSILGAILFEAVGIDSAVGFFINNNEEAHAMVLVHLSSLSGYGYWYYDDLTDIGLAAGEWILLEPQVLLGEQDTDWMTQWYIVVAGALD